MSNAITCTRCGETRGRMPFQPFPTELGRKVYEQICEGCWAEWLKLQQQLINHYGLNLREPRAKEFLLEQMQERLFTTSSPPSGPDRSPGPPAQGPR